jgi:hypothetical protein
MATSLIKMQNQLLPLNNVEYFKMFDDTGTTLKESQYLRLIRMKFKTYLGRNNV